MSMPSLWDIAGEDAEANARDLAMRQAKHASAGTLEFLYASASEFDLDNRLAIASDRIRATASAAGIAPADLESELRREVSTVLDARQAAHRYEVPDGPATHYVLRDGAGAIIQTHTPEQVERAISDIASRPELGAVRRHADGRVEVQLADKFGGGSRVLEPVHSPGGFNQEYEASRKANPGKTAVGPHEASDGCNANHIYHDNYGDVTRPQLAAYRKHNISPSDHDSLVDEFGEHDHKGIIGEVKRQTDGGGMFSFLDIGRNSRWSSRKQALPEGEPYLQEVAQEVESDAVQGGGVPSESGEQALDEGNIVGADRPQLVAAKHASVGSPEWFDAQFGKAGKQSDPFRG